MFLLSIRNNSYNWENFRKKKLINIELNILILY